ncbi:sensor histidine kinase [Flavisolibacter nicotianae]|uniref:sensor histidine kinase n=1 Tax=Flavisolibacter nicotianae TaxID=2364882 RepID=UPI000EAC6AC7|nr:histidine kinase [Flavisolibacter nicotianae]
MKLRLPQYSGKDHLVLAIIFLPLTMGLNAIIFGGRYFTRWDIFLPTTLLTSLVFSVNYIICSAFSIWLKNRMPAERQTNRRLLYMIALFVALSGVFLLTVFHGYEFFPSFSYTFNEKRFTWAYMGIAIIDIFMVILMEGISNYNHWRENLKETEKLKKTFKQSQLLGLKSQVNPHFLFNSLNTLSSLITEDEKEAETFLNEMTKVYRYLLRGDDEQLVPLQTELKFIEAYNHLLDRRFGQSLQVQLHIREEDKTKLIPPLSLQVLIENAFTQNSMSKTDPLVIRISTNGDDLVVQNSRKPKSISNAIDFEAGLDNLVTKYRLLTAAEVVIRDEESERSIYLPLIEKKGVVA